MILDLIDPKRPEEVGRWWIPGQWEAGGEAYPWANWTHPVATIRCVEGIGSTSVIGTTGFSFWTSITCPKPKLVSSVNTSFSFPHPTHTCLAMPERLKGRDVMVVADEDVAKLLGMRACLHVDL